MKKIIIGTVYAIVILNIVGCVAVKPYQMAQLNNQDMKLSTRTIQKMESNFQSYREGASGANGGKTGGGCGCN